MRLKMQVALAGNLYSLAPGDEWDFPEAEALRLIEAEYAIAVLGEVEQAVVRPALERRGKKGRPDVVHAESNDGADG